MPGLTTGLCTSTRQSAIDLLYHPRGQIAAYVARGRSTSGISPVVNADLLELTQSLKPEIALTTPPAASRQQLPQPLQGGTFNISFPNEAHVGGQRDLQAEIDKAVGGQVVAPIRRTSEKLWMLGVIRATLRRTQC